MKISLFKSKIFFNFLISILLTVTLVPLNLTCPEDDFTQAVNEYQDVVSDYSLYSTVRNQSRTRDYDDQYFSKHFTLDCLQYRFLNSVILFSEQFVCSELLSYQLISLPPPVIS